MKISFWCRFYSDAIEVGVAARERKKGGKIIFPDEICFSTYSADSEKLPLAAAKKTKIVYGIFDTLLLLCDATDAVSISEKKKHRIMCLTLSWYTIKADVAANPRCRSILSSAKGKYLFYVVMFTLSRAKENFRDNFCWFRARREHFKGKIWKTRGVDLLPMPSANICWSLFCFRRLKAKKLLLPRLCCSFYDFVMKREATRRLFLLLRPHSRPPPHPAAEEQNYFPAWFHFKWFLGCFLPQKENNFHFVDEKVFLKLIHLGSLFVVDV